MLLHADAKKNSPEIHLLSPNSRRFLFFSPKISVQNNFIIYPANKANISYSDTLENPVI